MKHSHTIATALLLALLPLSARAQGEGFEAYRQAQRREYKAYSDARRQEFAAYRRERNEEFAALLRQKWEAFRHSPARPWPKQEERPPVVCPQPQELPPTAPIDIPRNSLLPLPKPQPQPQPVRPIDEAPKEESKEVEFAFFGTKERVRASRKQVPRLQTLNAEELAHAWLTLSGEEWTNLVHDCLRIRLQRQLCDWAYLHMLAAMAQAVCGGAASNEATLLQAYAFCQSGYKMRLCILDGRMEMLFASRHQIFELPYFLIGSEQFYALHDIGGEAQVCTGEFRGEQPLSLLIPDEQKLDFAPTSAQPTPHVSERYPSLRIETQTNQNLLDFYSTYPTSTLGPDVMTRWAMYALTPLATRAQKAIYPALRKALEDRTARQAVEMLLNLVQTGFVYQKDDETWGHDRTFFAEETLHYPGCDCEDRSVLFARLVRDLLHLPVALVFYPGHLATAVCIPGEVQGEHFVIAGQCFTLCDPTYIHAPAGLPMPGMKSQEAKVMVLEGK